MRVDELGDVRLGEGVLEAESIRTAWRTLEKVSDGAAPTCSDGLSGRLSSGKAASIAALRRFSASYSASLIRGASAWW